MKLVTLLNQMSWFLTIRTGYVVSFCGIKGSSRRRFKIYLMVIEFLKPCGERSRFEAEGWQRSILKFSLTFIIDKYGIYTINIR